MMGNKKNAAVNHHYAKTAKRLMGYVAGTYRLQFVCVLVTIVISALANVAGPLFLMVLIDDFITPLLGQHPDFTVLNHVMAGLAAFYVAGVICTYTYNRLMILARASRSVSGMRCLSICRRCLYGILTVIPMESL